MDRADRSPATVRKVSRIACSLARSCVSVNDFLPDAILTRDRTELLRTTPEIFCRDNHLQPVARL